MERTKRRGALRHIVAAVVAAVLAAAPLLPHATAYADTGGVHISSYEIEGGYAPVNEGVGYRTADGQVSYCYDHDAHGPGRAGQDYTDIREATHAEDYLLAKGYPMTNEIGGTEWSDVEAQAVTQMAVWLASGTASEGDFADADPAMVAATESLAGEAEAYQGGDATIDGRGTVCFVAGKPAVQSMLVAKPGWNITLDKASAPLEVALHGMGARVAGYALHVRHGYTLTIAWLQMSCVSSRSCTTATFRSSRFPAATFSSRCASPVLRLPRSA